MGGDGDDGGDGRFFCLPCGVQCLMDQPSLTLPLARPWIPITSLLFYHPTPHPGSALFSLSACTLAWAFHRHSQTPSPAYSCTPPCPSSQMVSSSTSPEVSLATPPLLPLWHLQGHLVKHFWRTWSKALGW